MIIFTDLQGKFLSLLQNLPDIWREKYGTMAAFDSNNNLNSSVLSEKDINVPINDVIHTTVKNSEKKFSQSHRSISRSKSPTTPLKADTSNNWTVTQSPGIIRSSHADIQGIRAVVRSKGDDLTVEYWKDLSRSLLPLHRAISGLHFHGSEKLLLATLKCLHQLGADINLTDPAGNTVLHKAIQVCTSKSVAVVVDCLIKRGVDATKKNQDGDTPLHSECRRVRSASVEVIEVLVSARANVNEISGLGGEESATPLTLVLQRGVMPSSSASPTITTTATTATNNATIRTSPHSDSQGNQVISDEDKRRSGSRRVWVRAADALIRAGKNLTMTHNHVEYIIMRT